MKGIILSHGFKEANTDKFQASCVGKGLMEISSPFKLVRQILSVKKILNC